MLIEPDYSDVVELKPGQYNARVTDCSEKTSRAGGKYLEWPLEIVDNADPKLNGKKVTLRTMMAGKGAGRLKQLVRAVVNPNYESGGFDTDAIVGQVVTIVLKEGRNEDGSRSDFPEVASVSRPKA